MNRRYDSLGVEWEEPEGDDVEGYRLEVGTPSNPRQFTRDYERGTTSADVPGLTPDTDYQVNLVSTSPSGESEPVRRSARTSECLFPIICHDVIYIQVNTCTYEYDCCKLLCLFRIYHTTIIHSKKITDVKKSLFIVKI